MRDGIGGDYLRVDHASLDRAAADLESAISTAVRVIGDLDAALAPLQQWEGAAKTAYVDAKRIWDGAMADLTGIAIATRTAVQDANASYREVDRRAASYFEGMGI